MKKQLLLLVMILVPLLANASSDIIIDGIYYNFDDVNKTATVTTTIYAGVRCYSGDVVVPSTVTYKGVLYSVTAIGHSAFQGETGMTSVTIPESVTLIDEWGFRNCTGLTSISIPENVRSIGDEAFYGCTNLETIIIPENIEAIGRSAFANTLWYNNKPDGLVYVGKTVYKYKGTMPDNTSIKIKSGTKSIVAYAFSECTSLTSVTIPNSVTSIGMGAFDGCTGLTSIAIPSSVSFIDGYAFRNCTGLTSVTIPNGITTLGSSIFYGCSGLKSVTIPNSITLIGYEAFGSCKNLESVDIPNSVITIGITAFRGCTKLKSISIPESVTTIGEGAFSYCYNLESIEVPNSVTAIGGSAFNYTAWYNNQPNGLIYIGKVAYIYKGTMPDNTSCTLKEGTKGIAGGAFLNCSGLSSITIPETVVSIGKAAFQSCSGLTSLSIPNSVTNIEQQAFQRCSSLISITIPKSVSSIGNWAFDTCSKLTDVYCYAKKAPSADANIFENSPIEKATLHVLETSLEEYMVIEPWKNFKTIEGVASSEYKLSYIVDGVLYKEYEYKEGVVITPEAVLTKEGYTFSGWSEIPETMPAHDITVTGTFTINKYKLKYIVDEVEYKSYDVEYGAAITPEDEPTKEGYTFSGWSDIPMTMPAHDVNVTGTYTKDPPGKCALPTISIENGRIVFNCETEGVNYHYYITHSDVKSGDGNDVELTNTYTIKVYATKDEYEKSDVATKEIKSSDISTSVLGDVNGDGLVNAADIVKIANIIMGQ